MERVYKTCTLSEITKLGIHSQNSLLKTPRWGMAVRLGFFPSHIYGLTLLDGDSSVKTDGLSGMEIIGGHAMCDRVINVSLEQFELK